MPWAAPRACFIPGCPWSGHGRCPRHGLVARQRYDQARGSAAARGYGSWTWKTLRAAVLARDRVCVLCGSEPAVIADHRIAKRDGGTDTVSNLQGLGWRCHARKSAAEKASRRKTGMAFPISKKIGQRHDRPYPEQELGRN
jgi:5-methylcytosine-specific restriction protein A